MIQFPYDYPTFYTWVRPIEPGDDLMPDNYHIEYGVQHDGKVGSAMSVYLNEGCEHGIRIYYVGMVFRHKGHERWEYKPPPQLEETIEVGTFGDSDLHIVKRHIEQELRDAGILALGGGPRYDPKTGVGIKAKTGVGVKGPAAPAKRKRRNKKPPRLICTNTFITGEECTRPVADHFVDKNEAFHLCTPCAEELGIS